MINKGQRKDQLGVTATLARAAERNDSTRRIPTPPSPMTRIPKQERTGHVPLLEINIDLDSITVHNVTSEPAWASVRGTQRISALERCPIGTEIVIRQVESG